LVLDPALGWRGRGKSIPVVGDINENVDIFYYIKISNVIVDIDDVIVVVFVRRSI